MKTSKKCPCGEADMATALAQAPDAGDDTQLQTPGVQALVVGVATGPGRWVLDGAEQLARQFRLMGFETELLLDPDKEALETAMDQFAARSAAARMAIFAYGGHGIEHNRVNYLLPKGAVLTSSGDIETKMVSLSRLFGKLESLPQVAKIFILDACRSLPRQAWLPTDQAPPPVVGDPTGSTPRNSLVAFAAPPGQIALEGFLTAYSPFTDAILESLPARGESVNDLFDQVRLRVQRETRNAQLPWTATQLRPEIQLLPAIKLDARFNDCDDVAFLFHNRVLKRACPDSSVNEPIVLVPGTNELSVGIYNQKTWVGSRPPIFIEGIGVIPGTGVAEGWSYELTLTLEGQPFQRLSGGEDTTDRDGRRHGYFFIASKVVLDLEPFTGLVTVLSVEPELWRNL